MSDNSLGQTDLGKLYNVLSHGMGRWLVAAGLRTADKKPSTKAFQGRFDSRRDSTQPGTYYWVWQAEMTMLALQESRAQGGPTPKHPPHDDEGHEHGRP